VYYELTGLQEILYGSIQMYANEVVVLPSSTIPRSSILVCDADGDGAADQKDGANVAYSTWTARLLKAAYNYQVSAKDPGPSRHNAKYIIELLYDSIETSTARSRRLLIWNHWRERTPGTLPAIRSLPPLGCGG